MSAAPIPDRLLDQWRATLRAAGIQPTDSDMQGVIEKGFLGRVADFERLIAGFPIDGEPDYLADSAPPPGDQAQAGALAADPGSPIGALAAQLSARQISPVELIEQTLARIAERDPQLNAFQLVLAEQARSAAGQAEREIAAGDYRGPLHGVPIAVKDLLDVAGTPTAAGSRLHADRVAESDATAVARLRAAGAIIVGKTRMPEFAYSPGSINPHYGPTRNPHNLERDTGGSSSGSGAAVADRLVPAALGSDTGGSIRIPSALCGIVGLKPTFGRTSLAGATPLAWSLDHLGPMTRSVPDAALLLAALAGPDPRDPRTRPGSEFAVPADLDAGVRGLRIGVVRDDGSGAPLGTPAALAAWQIGLEALESAGAKLVPIDLPELEALRIVNGALLAVEAATYHEPALRDRLGEYGDFMRQRILAALGYGPRALVRAQQARALLRRRCAAAFEQVDVISTLTQPDVAPPLNGLGWLGPTGPFNALGWPAISVPIGQSAGLPLGMQLVGQPWHDATVLRAARALELALPNAKG